MPFASSITLLASTSQLDRYSLSHIKQGLSLVCWFTGARWGWKAWAIAAFAAKKEALLSVFGAGLGKPGPSSSLMVLA